jgi:hypothetical protein
MTLHDILISIVSSQAWVICGYAIIPDHIHSYVVVSKPPIHIYQTYAINPSRPILSDFRWFSLLRVYSFVRGPEYGESIPHRRAIVWFNSCQVMHIYVPRLRLHCPYMPIVIQGLIRYWPTCHTILSYILYLSLPRHIDIHIYPWATRWGLSMMVSWYIYQSKIKICLTSMHAWRHFVRYVPKFRIDHACMP